MSNTTTSTPNRSLNEIMSNDDVGTFFTKNKNALIAFSVAILVAVVGFGLFSTFSDKSKANFNSKIYAFESTTLKTWTDKSDPKAMVLGIKNLSKELGNYAGLFPVVLKASDALMSSGHLNEAAELLAIGLQVSKNSYANYFIMARLAVVYEDLGQDQLAIETLLKMNDQSVKIFEGKNYLDLGRLYLKTGDKAKAKASFTFVVEKAKDEAEFVKIAKLNLLKL
jgi:predicted negative regulator of RcsB-dependent stress response